MFNVTAGTSSISSLTIRDGRVFGGVDGAGISVSNGTVTVTNSTLSGNSAGGGGINVSVGTVTVTNSILSGNLAAGGGGIDVSGGTVTVTNSTLSGNSATIGGGVFQVSGAIQLRATLLDTGSSGANCSGTVTSLGSNLSDDNSCNFAQTGDQNNVATLNLGPLADNGGPTQTHALGANSAAIDAVQDQCTTDGTNGGTAIGFDQRGVVRPRGGACDVGAFESATVAAGTLQFSAPTFSVGEVGPTATVTVTRTGGADGTISATVSLADGTATASADHDPTARTVSFAAGDAVAKTVNIPIVDDALDEADETIALTLGGLTSSLGGASIGAPSTITVTILDTTAPAPPLQGQDDTDASRKNTNARDGKDTALTEEQQRQREHTNRGNRDDVATEGNVVEVHQDETPPYIVIANRDGNVRINLLCGGQCPTIRVGDLRGGRRREAARRALRRRTGDPRQVADQR